MYIQFEKDIASSGSQVLQQAKLIDILLKLRKTVVGKDLGIFEMMQEFRLKTKDYPPSLVNYVRNGEQKSQVSTHNKHFGNLQVTLKVISKADSDLSRQVVMKKIIFHLKSFQLSEMRTPRLLTFHRNQSLFSMSQTQFSQQCTCYF